MTENKEWIAVDWGTSNVRAWRMSESRTPLASTRSEMGMGRLNSDGYPPVLDELLKSLDVDVDDELQVVVCGMAGARQGWIEAPYLNTPARLTELGLNAVRAPHPNARISVSILSGLRQDGAFEDVMRGEETQLLGLMSLKPDFNGVVCMPGTHSKWVNTAAGRVEKFATAMTGELYDVLSKHSVLRHSLQGDPEGPALEEGISEGLRAGREYPERLTSLLFRTRASSLLSGKTPDWCSGYLSGLLVGAECAAYRDWIDGKTVNLIGSNRLMRLYASALAQMDIHSEPVDATEAALYGLAKAKEHITHG